MGLKGLAIGVGAVILAGYIAQRTKAAEGLKGMAAGITQAIGAPFTGLGQGLSALAGGISDVFSPTIAPTIAPVFDWSGWLPFGNGNGRPEDRNNGNGAGKGFGGNGAGARVSTKVIIRNGRAGRIRRGEDRTTQPQRTMLY